MNKMTEYLLGCGGKLAPVEKAQEEKEESRFFSEGDTITVQGDSGFCDPPSKEKIKKIAVRYDKKTGIPYKIYYAGNQWFDGRNGCAISGARAYYIAEI